MSFQRKKLHENRNIVVIVINTFLLSIAAVTALAQQPATEGEEILEEVVVVGTQIKGAAISEALAVSIIDAVDIEALGIASGDELLDYMPEQGQNFFNEAENIGGGVNSARGDIGAFNLRNMAPVIPWYC